MDIVIFEDDTTFTRSLEEMVANISHQTSNFTIALSTADFNGLCHYIELLEKPTIFILDIMFGNHAQGFKMADIISKHQQNAIIVFITGYPNMILANSVYKIKAFNIILKSSKKLEHELTLTLQEALKFITDNNILIHSDKFKTIAINIADIQYVETILGKNKIRVSGKSGVYELRMSLSKFQKLLPSNFIRCHNSYIINGAKISSINNTLRTIKTESGDTIYYSYRHRKRLENSIKSGEVHQ